MQDDLQCDFRPIDPGRVGTIDPVEMRYWCRELHCSDEQLKNVVRRVGVHIAAVRDELALARD